MILIPSTKISPEGEDEVENAGKDPSTRQMLKMMLNQHQRSLERALKATSTKEKKTSITEDKKIWMDDQRMKVIELEALPSR